MADFPTTLPTPASAPWELHDPFIEDTYLDGGDTARPLYSAPREKEKPLTWAAMSKADVATLKAFYLAQRATPFNWTDPWTSEVMSVRFIPGGVRVDPLKDFPGYARVTVKIRRVGVVS